MSVLTFADAVGLIRDARSFDELSRVAGYREWARIVHPDAVGAGSKAAATDAFAKLSRLHDRRSRWSGDVADLTVDDGTLVKVPRDPADNDLMDAEAQALTRLYDEGDPVYRPYAPRLIRSFTHEDANRVRRRVNVLELLDGFVPLSALRRELDPRDAAWMWRRLLVGLGWAHRARVVHGAILEEHVLIHPGEHGVALVDWCYSGGVARAIVAARRDAYPPEVLRDKVCTPATDIYMATGLMTRLIGGGMPAAMRRFADGCRYDAPRMRPQDAWALLGEFDELLYRLYGPRTFRPFSM